MSVATRALGMRQKFGLLVLLYVAALVVNVAVCSWCILVCFSSLLAGFAPPAGLDERLTTVIGLRADDWSVVVEDRWLWRVLLANVAVGLLLALGGLRMVRRWVSLPVADLREAAAQIGAGNLGHRAPVRSGDELGMLTREVNRMAGMILDYQAELVAQEKRAVALQTLRCVIHNIRSPLTGIRWLAEALSLRRDLPEEVVRGQNRIVALVDEALNWLQGFRQTMIQAALRPEPVDLGRLLQQVAAASAEAPDGQTPPMEALPLPQPRIVPLDPGQMRESLLALAGWLGRELAEPTTLRLVALDSAPHEGMVYIWLTTRSPDQLRAAELPGSFAPVVSPQGEPGGGLMPAAVLTAMRVIRVHGGELLAPRTGGIREFLIRLPCEKGGPEGVCRPVV